MLKNREKKAQSLVGRITRLMMLVIILQAAFSLYTIILTNVATTLESYSYNSFISTIQSRKSYLENFMTASWSNITDYSITISENYIEIAGDHDSLTEEDKVEFLNASIEPLMEMILKTGTTGGFIILNDGENMKYNYSTVYLKSDNYLTQIVDSNSLILAKGPTEISKEYKFSLSSQWSYGIKLNEDTIPILDRPLEATEITKNLGYLGYWHISKDITNEKLQVLTYSVPIFDKNEQPIGVVGIEVSEDYLYKFLPVDEFSQTGSYGYMLADVSQRNDDEITPVVINGVVQEQVVQLDEPIKLSNIGVEEHNLDVVPKLLVSQETEICVYYEELKLYVNNSPFANDSIWLAGMTELDNITSFTIEFWQAIRLMIIVALAGGLIISYFVGRRVAAPILSLSKEVSTNDFQEKIKFEKTDVKELDELVYVIQQLQENILKSAYKTEQILELLNVQIGSFEYIKGTNTVTISQAMYKMLGLEEPEKSSRLIDKDIFFQKLEELTLRPIEEIENTYAVGVLQTKYYTVIEHDQEDILLGVMSDATKDVEALLVLNYERNYDVLTGIFNRRAFHQKVVDVFRTEVMKVAGFVMIDLDNLKYVNDTFGHDSGDVYIKTAATMIYTSLHKYGVVGRMSGDEFYAYLYGFDTKEELITCLNNLYARLEVEPIEMPNLTEFKIRMSGGLAWYGDDSVELEELMKYADFAMYKGKLSSKGELRYFDKDTYLAASFMLSGKAELNRILEHELVNFVYQPIINVKTSEIYAYEALMRPTSEILETPQKLLQIAAFEGKSWKVEKLTLFKTLFLYKTQRELFKDAKLFINSIPNEKLKEEEYEELKAVYGDCLSQIVVEITEHEQQNKDIVDYKLKKLHPLGVDVALDDYGAGYSNDVSLLNLHPDIIKIDRSIISNVHVDPSRQAIIKKIITLCKDENIVVLAEGIETEQELEYLYHAGIQLAQGYYISRPLAVPNFNNKDIKEKLLELENEKSV